MIPIIAWVPAAVATFVAANVLQRYSHHRWAYVAAVLGVGVAVDIIALSILRAFSA